MVASTAAAAAAGAGNNVLIAVKLLMSVPEATALIGLDATTLQQIQGNTSTSMRLSEAIYPGTELLELTIQGMAKEAVFLALMHVTTVVVDLCGSMGSGDDHCDKGCLRMKLILPAKAAASVIGVGGQSVKHITTQCNVRIQVDHTPIPAGPGGSEQALLLAGTLTACQNTLPHILEHVGLIATEKDLVAWAAHTNTGTPIPGLILFAGNPTGKGRKPKHDRGP